MKLKNKKSYILLFLFLLMVPLFVYADSSDGIFMFFEAVFAEAFLSIHMSLFVISPLSKLLKDDIAEQKKMFWKIFKQRVIILFILDLFIPEIILVIDFLMVFIGAFILVPIVNSSKFKNGKNTISTVREETTINANVCCPDCGSVIENGNKFCTNCGKQINSGVSSNLLMSAAAGTKLDTSTIFGYDLTEEQMLTQMIQDEIQKNGESPNISIASVEKKKNIFGIVYAIIFFICLSLLFFHSNTLVLIIIFIVISIIYYNINKKYDLTQYLIKEVKARPDEKISYIVSSVLPGKVDNSFYKIFRISLLVVAVIVPLFIFKSPHIIYEKQDDAYVVRFYTIGWLENDKELVIPAEYKDKPVVGIRGDVFANVHTIEKVVLPDTVQEIRGGAFANAINLEEINLPEGIPEIKGNTFEGCSSLKEISIPDSVTRIGGHAFRENSSLEKVNISASSKLKEIGSSAFRDCYLLKEIYLPRGVNINERAFKNSGTKVKEYNLDGIALENEFEYDTYLYLEVGVFKQINEYRTSAISQGYYIILTDVEGFDGDYIYNLRVYKDEEDYYEFSLKRDHSYIILDKYEIAVEVVGDYIFDLYDNSVPLNVYYN